MSIRQHNLGSIVKPGFNALGPQAPVYEYFPYLNAWGLNSHGRLGDGTTTNRSSPVQIGALTTWADISAGYQMTLSTKTDGTLWAWGFNNYGQLGLTNTTAYSSPKQVGALTDWLSVTGAGYNFSASIKTNGTLWTWGYNNNGQLGHGNTSDINSPKQVGALTDWLKISAGDYNFIATKTDGTLWSWGKNNVGQLGDGTTTNRSSPVQVGALTTWYSVASGSLHTMATKTDGTLWTWGQGSFGKLGLGNTTSYSSPKQVGTLTDWLTIASGGQSSFAIKTDGTLWTWGYANDGALGHGNGISYSSPKQLGALTNWTKTAAGGNYFGGAIKTDGTLWTWGGNASGQLGLGNTTNISSPQQVGALTNWLDVSMGLAHTVSTTY